MVKVSLYIFSLTVPNGGVIALMVVPVCSLRTYLKTALKEARLERDRLQALIKQGMNPLLAFGGKIGKAHVLSATQTTFCDG